MGPEKRMQCGQTDAAQDGRGADGAWNWMGLGKVAPWSGTSWLLYGRISTSLGLGGRGTRGKFLGKALAKAFTILLAGGSLK